MIETIGHVGILVVVIPLAMVGAVTVADRFDTWLRARSDSTRGSTREGE